MGARSDHERAIRSQMPRRDTLVIAGASILDGVIGLVTLGHFIGTFRQKASLWGARRLASRQYWL